MAFQLLCKKMKKFTTDLIVNWDILMLKKKEKDLEFVNMLMDLNMKATGKKVQNTAMENTHLQMAIYMKVNGKMIVCME